MPVMTAPESALEELLAEAKVMSRKFVDLELKFQNQFVSLPCNLGILIESLFFQ